MRNEYVLNDAASAYYEELEDYGKTRLKKPSFAEQCDLCGLCHRTGRRCEDKVCYVFAFHMKCYVHILLFV